ncbi:MAG: hypothetical protein Q8O84_02900 [Nanoarchaeota archaeon]|nr:hypothetical protein [Nanoarchaeota archaeon]
MTKISKTLGTLLLAGLTFNSFSQDTIKTADGYTIKNKEGYIIQDAVIKGKDWKEIREYNAGKLTKLTTFSKDMKDREYAYNEKGQLMTETIYNKEGKIKGVINRELEK